MQEEENKDRNVLEEKAQVKEKCELNFEKEKNKHIIKELQTMEFPFLCFLNLAQNRIASIEGLDRIKAPSLSSLVLRMNNIVSIPPLRKCYFPSLIKLQLEYNRIVESGCLSELYFYQQLMVYLQYQSWNLHQCETCFWAMKLSNVSCEMRSPKRINKEKFYQAHKRKQNKSQLMYDHPNWRRYQGLCGNFQTQQIIPQINRAFQSIRDRSIERLQKSV